MIAVVDDQAGSQLDECVELHTFLYGGTARLLLVWVFVVLLVGVPGGAGYLLVTGQARDLVNLFGVAAALCVVSWVTVRERPLVYGSRAGLDLEWAWGKKRHIAWKDIRHVKTTSLLGRFIGRRFRLELPKGSVEFYARPDLPKVIERFKRGSTAN